MENFKAYFDQKFASIAKKSLATVGRQTVLTKKGNQAQFDHATQVLDLLLCAEEALKDEDTLVVGEKLKQARIETQKRMKLIKLADKSEHGWSTVNEYLSDDLASDSGDERRMRRAENQAGHKKKKLQQQSAAKRFKGSAGNDTLPRPSTSKQFFRSSKEFQYNDKCFRCGRTGHWRIHCPSNKSQLPELSYDRKPPLL